jgi:hypothetical protein
MSILTEEEKCYNIDFKKFTKYLNANLGKYQNELSINILNSLLDKLHHKIDKSVLFVSAGKGSSRTSQDTIYAGKIICTILSEQYPNIHFSTTVIKCSVVAVDELIKTYRSIFTKYHSTNPGKHLIYCDAGGTSQQKLASKVNIEYIFPEKLYEVYYISQFKEGESKAIKLKNIEYRQIIDKEHVRNSISIGAYSAAVNIFINRNLQPLEKEVILLLKFCQYRQGNLKSEAEIIAKQLLNTKLFSKDPFIVEYLSKPAYCNFINFSELVSQSDFYTLCDIAEIAFFQLEKEMFSEFVLKIFQFIEYYLYATIGHCYGYDLTSEKKHYKEKDRLLKEAEIKFPNLREKWPTGALQTSVPLYVKILENTNIDVNKKILHIISECNSLLRVAPRGNNFYGLDTFRNKLAHNGKLVEGPKLQKQDYFESLKKIKVIIGLPKKNSYDRVNELIMSAL